MSWTELGRNRKYVVHRTVPGSIASVEPGPGRGFNEHPAPVQCWALPVEHNHREREQPRWGSIVLCVKKNADLCHNGTPYLHASINQIICLHRPHRVNINTLWLRPLALISRPVQTGDICTWWKSGEAGPGLSSSPKVGLGPFKGSPHWYRPSRFSPALWGEERETRLSQPSIAGHSSSPNWLIHEELTRDSKPVSYKCRLNAPGPV